MKKLIFLLLLAPVLAYGEPDDIDKLIADASPRNEKFYLIECEYEEYIARKYNFQGSVLQIYTAIDTARNNRKSYIINVVGCSIMPFISTMIAELQKLKDEEAEVAPSTPNKPSLESISKRRVQLRQAIDVLQQRLKAEYFYTDEKQKMYDAIDFLKDELTKLPMPGEL